MNTRAVVKSPGELWRQRGRRFGALLQGVTLGLLLAIAVLELIALASDATIFQYQGF